MKFIFKKLVAASVLTLLTNTAYASDSKSGVESLSVELRTLLTKEMVALDDGMKSVYSDLIAGNWNELAHTATKIHNSFILKQELTKEQGKELMTKLPHEFILKDKAFHKQAAMLAHAAENENKELANFYVYKMTESCVSCHSSYAQHRFPSFAEKVSKHSHQH